MANDDEADLEDLRSQLGSVTTAAHELEQAMPLVGEAVELIRGVLDDLVDAIDESNADEYADDLDRLATLGSFLRRHQPNL